MRPLKPGDLVLGSSAAGGVVVRVDHHAEGDWFTVCWLGDMSLSRWNLSMMWSFTLLRGQDP